MGGDESRDKSGISGDGGGAFLGKRIQSEKISGRGFLGKKKDSELEEAARECIEASRPKGPMK